MQIQDNKEKTIEGGGGKRWQKEEKEKMLLVDFLFFSARFAGAKTSTYCSDIIAVGVLSRGLTFQHDSDVLKGASDFPCLILKILNKYLSLLPNKIKAMLDL